ncbi:GNAT family N-acetyltransferase [Nocardioides dongkuii]|uniref:GNAT family N-acetyltransferase n=1 Tax=Nocardioides dongkuii TaxID=2760089 RepID=UPI0015F7A348|nr:GNAT family N-acetyltransferase [Nocardioides dongkuii]
MTDVRVREIDPTDGTALRSWWEVGAASSAHDRAYDGWPSWDVARPLYSLPRTDLARRLLLATKDSVVVGSGFLVLFLADNRHLAELDVQVHPDHRRRGVGRAVLAELERLAADDGRTAYVGSAYAPPGEGSPSTAFAEASGYPVASREETKLLDLRTAPASWGPLEAEVAAHLGGYRVVAFEDRVPEEWVPDFCDLLSAFMTMVPRGDLDVGAASWTPERLHEVEERTAATGRRWLVAVGVTPGGGLCGFHELGVVAADPRVATVGGTLVLPGHRGHRIGLGMKLATHRRVLELFPDATSVVTSNAGVNAAMNAVNEALGYRVVEQALDVQKRVRPS